MFKRKQLQEQHESERRELGLEKEDFEGNSSGSDSEVEESSHEGEMSEDEDREDEGSRSGATKTKVMILGSRGINSRYYYTFQIHLTAFFIQTSPFDE